MYNHENTLISRECSAMFLAIKEGKVVNGEEFVTEQPNGIRCNVIAYLVVNLNSGGEVIGVTNMLTDITHLKAIQHKALTLVDHLQSKNKELEQFTYLVSRGLIATVVRILGLGGIFHIDSVDHKLVIQKITEEATHLDTILKDINIMLSARQSKRRNAGERFFQKDNKYNAG